MKKLIGVKFRISFLFVLVLLTLVISVQLNAEQIPFNVDNKAQLFIDRLLVRETDRVWFTQHHGKKHPQYPLIVADQPWEGWGLGSFCAVIYDKEKKIFKMWYGANQGENAWHPERNAEVSQLAGKPVTLRFHLKNAQFYSFAFRD